VLEDPAEPEILESSALSLFARPGETGIETRRIAILVGDGVRDAATIHVALAAAGAVPRYVSPTLGTVDVAGGESLPVDITLEAAPSALFDALVLPDNGTSVDRLLANGQVAELIKEQFRHCKAILAIGTSTALLDAARLPKALPSGEPDPGVLRADAARAEVLTQFMAAVARHRHYARETDPPII
jgi:catalase